MDNKTLIFGPSYVDLVINVDDRIIGQDIFLDQSIPYIKRLRTARRKTRFTTLNGSKLTVVLPEEFADFNGHLQCVDIQKAGIFDKTLTPLNIKTELGGMGSGYAAALNGLLIYPAFNDNLGEILRGFHRKYKIKTYPLYSKYPTDSSIVILNDFGEKLAGGTRNQISSMRVNDDLKKLTKDSERIVFCGANNDFCKKITDNILKNTNNLPQIILAPAMRNILSENVSLVDISPYFSYLTMNRGEWERLTDKEKLVAKTKLITITDGGKNIEIIWEGKSEFMPPVKPEKIVDVNRAGETFSSYIINNFEDIFDIDSAVNIACQASKMAAIQLGISEFRFPFETFS